MIKTLHFKLRNPPKAFLKQAKFEVNQVWNQANGYSYEVFKASKNQVLNTEHLENQALFQALNLKQALSQALTGNTFPFSLIQEKLRLDKKEKAKKAKKDKSDESKKNLDKKENKDKTQKSKKIQDKPFKLFGFFEEKPKLEYLSHFDLITIFSNQNQAHICEHYPDYFSDFKAINMAVKQEVFRELTKAKSQFKKAKLKFRSSKKSLGWIPFKLENINILLDGARVIGKTTTLGLKKGFRLFLKDAKFKLFHKEKQFNLMDLLSLEKNLFDLKAFISSENTKTQEKATLKQQKDKDQYLKTLFVKQKFEEMDCEVALKHDKNNEEKLDLNHTQKKHVSIKILNQKFRIFNEKYLTYYLENLKAKVKSGSLAENNLGEWFLNLSVEIEDDLYFFEHLIKNKNYSEIAPHEILGIDPGLKFIMVCSDGYMVPALQYFRDRQEKLAKLQAGGKQKRKKYKQLMKKIKYQREDFLQKLTTDLVRNNQIIKIGDLNIKALSKNKRKKKANQHQALQAEKGKQKPKKDKSKTTGPRMGKAFHDNGLGKAKNMMSHKSHWARRQFFEVCEKYTTIICSKCDHFTGPTGLRQLDVREWTCKVCNTLHLRDVCSGENIARVIPGETLLTSVARCGHLYAEKRKLEQESRLGQAKPAIPI